MNIGARDTAYILIAIKISIDLNHIHSESSWNI